MATALAAAPARWAVTAGQPRSPPAARRPPGIIARAPASASASAPPPPGTRLGSSSCRRSSSSCCFPAPGPRPTGRRIPLTAAAAAAAADDGGAGAGADLASRFAAELSARAATPPPPSPSPSAAAAEAALDGAMLGSLIRQKYGLAYDVDLVARKWGPSVMVSVNVMWKHDKQASWRLTAEEYAARLEYVAMALRAWGQSEAFVRGLAATKDKPRVGKAAAIFVEGVPEERLREFVSF